MSAWALIQVVFDLFLALGLFVVVMRMNRAPKDDPRLSRGLQLLQSKISVLEDLSDRTETQVNQLTAILDQKCREVQAKVQLAEQHVHAIRVSMERSREVAQIFQDKIPHQEIIERQNTIKYVHAARLAHQGLDVDEIASKVDLPKGEIEFIAKVNRDRLMFNEEQLPWWAKEGAVAEGEEGESAQAAPASRGETAKLPQAELGHLSFEENASANADGDQSARLRAEMQLAERQQLVENLNRLQFEMQNLDIQLARESSVKDMTNAFEVPKVETASLQKLGEEFRRACEEAEASAGRNPILPPLEQLTNLIPQVFNGLSGFAPETAGATASNAASAAAAPIAQPAAPTQPAAPSMMAMPQTQNPVAEPQAVPRTSEMASSAPVDPVLVRARAQAKVHAALSRTASAGPAQPGVAAPSASPELMAAREAAKAMMAPQPVATAVASGVAPTATQKQESVVRKVVFPRIDSPEK